MAEEKKTTGKKATTSVKKGEIKTGSASTKKGTTTRKSTTKKTTTKVEAVEKINIPVSEDTSEVRLEKKFCTKCGKELLGNAVCDCENGASVSETQRQNSDPMLSFFNRFTDLFKKMYKNPIETIKSETDKANLTNAVAILLIIGLSFGIFMMGFFKNMFISVTHLGVRIMAILSGNSGDMMTFTDLMDKSGEVSLPYFTQFLYGILIFLIFTAAIVLISYAIARVLKKNDFDLKKALTLFVVSMIPTIGVFLGMAVLGLFHSIFMMIIALTVGGILILVSVVNYVSLFLEYMEVSGVKKTYTITSLIAGFVIFLAIFTGLFGDSIAEGIYHEIDEKSSATIGGNSSFRW